MIRTILFSLVCFAIFSSALGQSRFQQLIEGPGPKRMQNLRRVVLHPQYARPAAKTTAPTQRITGTSQTLAGALNESAYYIYSSPTRGSYHSPNDLASYFFSFNVAGDNFPEIESYNDGGAPDIKCDSGIFSDGSGDVFRTIGLQYNNAQQPTVYRTSYQNTLTGNSTFRERYTLTYNGLGQRTEVLVEGDTTTSTASGGPYLQDSRQYTIYGGSPARALRDSVVSLPGAPYSSENQRVVYSYSGSNLISLDFYGDETGAFIHYGRYQFTYDASNRMRTFEFLFDDGAGLQPNTKDSMTYTGANAAPTGVYFSVFDAALGYVPDYSLRYTLNAQGLRDSLRVYNEANVLQGYAVYQYNSFGNPTIYNYYDTSYSAFTPFETVQFFYELYEPTSVTDERVRAQATAFPNPVHRDLTLTWKPVTGRPVIRIADAVGRTLEQTSLAAGSRTVTLDMSRYVEDTYFVTITGGTGEIQHIKVQKR